MKKLVETLLENLSTREMFLFRIACGTEHGRKQLTVHNDIFLYRNVTRTRKESSSSSFRSGGGSSRSVGGGSF